MTLEQLFAGRGFDVPAFSARMKKVAGELGLPFGMREMTYNSRRAQELGKWAESRGKGEAFHMAVFQAYFVHGLNIAEEPVLEKLSESVGLDPAQVRGVLAAGTYRDAVDRDWKYSGDCGITAVPTFVVDGRGVAGAQPYPVLEKLVRNAGAVPPG